MAHVAGLPGKFEGVLVFASNCGLLKEVHVPRLPHFLFFFGVSVIILIVVFWSSTGRLLHPRVGEWNTNGPARRTRHARVRSAGAGAAGALHENGVFSGEEGA